MTGIAEIYGKSWSSLQKSYILGVTICALGRAQWAITYGCTEILLPAAVFIKSDSACVKSIVTRCYYVPDSICEINYHTLGRVSHHNGAFFCTIVCIERIGRIIIK